MPGIRSNVNVRRPHSPGGASTGSTPVNSIRSRRLAKAVNFANIMSAEEAASFEDELFELPDFVTEDFDPHLLSRLKAAEGSMLAAKVRIGALKTITPADAEELCHMLGLSVEMRIQKSKAKKSDALLQEWEIRSESLDLEGFILLAGPLLGLPLPALKNVREEDESPLCLEEMLVYPEAEAIFKGLALDEDGCLPSKVLAQELLTPTSEVSMFFAEKALECSQPMKSRSKLVRLVTWRIERDDALGTLFFTFLLLLVLFFLVQENLLIHSRQKAESGVAQYLSAYGGSLTGPFLHEHVADVSFWGWTILSGLPAILGQPVVDAFGQTRLHIAGSNVLLGDVMLSHKSQDGAVVSHWLLHTEEAKTYLSNHTGDYLGAALAAVDVLRRTDPDWNDPYSEEIALSFNLHNAPASMFLNIQVRSQFFRTGDLDVRVQAQASIDNAEISAVQATLDILLVVLISWLAIAEAKDVIAALMHGCRAFTSYIGFWNAVDWACIGLAAVTACVWVLTGTRISSENLQFARQEGFDPMAPTEEQLAVMQEELLNIQHWLLSVRILTSLLTLTVIMKFFKGFRANPRLQIVADALMNSANNIAHFFMIFWTLFSCFAVIAHVLFGNDIVEFASLANSLEASMSTLMGEFEWYVRASGVKSGLMNSGMPIVAVHLWFVVYICFALLVLFNMLLAMVLDSYAVAAQVLTKRADAPTIVVQTWRYIQRWKETLRFIPLRHVANQLYDLDCHRQKVVTVTSLQEAFPQMKRNQAHWLMRTLFQEDKRAKATQKALEGQDQRHFFSQEGPDPSQIAAACVPVFKAAAESSSQELLSRLSVLEAKVDVLYGQAYTGLLKEASQDPYAVATEVESGAKRATTREGALCCAMPTDTRLTV